MELLRVQRIALKENRSKESRNGNVNRCILYPLNRQSVALKSGYN